MRQAWQRQHINFTDRLERQDNPDPVIVKKDYIKVASLVSNIKDVDHLGRPTLELPKVNYNYFVYFKHR